MVVEGIFLVWASICVHRFIYFFPLIVTKLNHLYLPVPVLHIYNHIYIYIYVL